MMNKDTTTKESGEEPISQLLRSLKRVEAPKDFDFHVRARIANGNPVKRTAPWLPAGIRYAVPLVLMLLIGGYFGYNSFYSPGDINVPAVADLKPADVSIGINTEPNFDSAPSQVAVVVPEPAVIETTNEPEKALVKKALRRNTNPKPSSERPGGGSYDAAIRPTINLNLIPLDPETNSNIPQDPKPADTKSLPSTDEFLKSAGINTGSAGQRVISVVGAAAKAGVKVGDLIESVNTANRSIKVLRDGKSVQIVLN